MTATPPLAAHLAAWLGSWPPELPLDVVGDRARNGPGRQGRDPRVVGVLDPDAGVVLSVPPAAVEPIELLGGLDPRVLAEPSWQAAVAQAVGAPGHRLELAILRWVDPSDDVADLPEAGTWVPRTDARLPAWLRGVDADEALVAFDDVGEVVGGVGIDVHDPHGAELAVVVAPSARGAGLGRRLVATAARRVLAEGRVATYVHDPGNLASAHVADAAGLPDRGWRLITLAADDTTA